MCVLYQFPYITNLRQSITPLVREDYKDIRGTNKCPGYAQWLRMVPQFSLLPRFFFFLKEAPRFQRGSSWSAIHNPILYGGFVSGHMSGIIGDYYRTKVFLWSWYLRNNFKQKDKTKKFAGGVMSLCEHSFCWRNSSLVSNLYRWCSYSLS